ncbi:hypothetical protein BH10BAC3_BH10BAC3_17250 [soil metagenome]
MKRITFVLLVLICSFSAFSQRAKKPNPYHFGVGAALYPNLKEPYALDFKFYTKGGHSLEFIAYNLQTAYRLTALFNPYFPIGRTGNLRMVIGPGLHVGMWKDGYKTNSYTTNPIIGVDGIAGIEYKIPKVPLSFQVHFQPSADLAGNNEFFYGTKWAGAVVRFAF